MAKRKPPSKQWRALVERAEEFELSIMRSLETVPGGYNTKENSGVFSMRGFYIGLKLAMARPDIAKAMVAEHDEMLSDKDSVYEGDFLASEVAAVIEGDIRIIHAYEESLKDADKATRIH